MCGFSPKLLFIPCPLDHMSSVLTFTLTCVMTLLRPVQSVAVSVSDTPTWAQSGSLDSLLIKYVRIARLIRFDSLQRNPGPTTLAKRSTRRLEEEV
jgi:hypothetical protein